MPSSATRQREITSLGNAVAQIGGEVEAEEAMRLADAAVEHSFLLAQKYRAVRPPWLHNHLVNAGFRPRGLCYHWANDLFARLHELRLRSLELHLAVARMDTRREHNAVVVTAPGQPFSQGMVLDAWRRSGRIWWGRADVDKYPWHPLPYERENPTLKELVTK